MKSVKFPKSATLRPKMSEAMSHRSKSFSAAQRPANWLSTAGLAAELGFDDVEILFFRGSELLAVEDFADCDDVRAKKVSRIAPRASQEALQGLYSDGPVFWRAVSGQQTSLARDQKGARSKSDPVSERLVIPVRLTSQICIVWVLSRNQAHREEFDAASLERLCGKLYLISGELHAENRMNLQPARPHLGITPREVEILNWFKHGKTYAEIAAILGISSKTVDYHLSKLMRKLNVYDKLSAILKAVRLGLIEND